jgi:hypothetical protein
VSLARKTAPHIEGSAIPPHSRADGANLRQLRAFARTAPLRDFPAKA